MSGHVRWADIRAEHVVRAGGEKAVEAGKQELLAMAVGHRLAEVRRARGLTQQQVAEAMGVTEGRVAAHRTSLYTHDHLKHGDVGTDVARHSFRETVSVLGWMRKVTTSDSSP